MRRNAGAKKHFTNATSWHLELFRWIKRHTKVTAPIRSNLNLTLLFALPFESYRSQHTVKLVIHIW